MMSIMKKRLGSKPKAKHQAFCITRSKEESMQFACEKWANCCSSRITHSKRTGLLSLHHLRLRFWRWWWWSGAVGETFDSFVSWERRRSWLNLLLQQQHDYQYLLIVCMHALVTHSSRFCHSQFILWCILSRHRGCESFCLFSCLKSKLFSL